MLSTTPRYCPIIDGGKWYGPYQELFNKALFYLRGQCSIQYTAVAGIDRDHAFNNTSHVFLTFFPGYFHSHILSL